MLRFRRDRVANTPPDPTTGIGHRRCVPARPSEERLTALHFRSPPRRTYGLFQTRPHGNSAAHNRAALEPPGQFRTTPLPLRCWIPPIRAPGQDSHLRSQHPCPAHTARPYGPRLRRTPRAQSLRATALGNFRDQHWGGFRDRGQMSSRPGRQRSKRAATQLLPTTFYCVATLPVMVRRTAT